MQLTELRLRPEMSLMNMTLCCGFVIAKFTAKVHRSRNRNNATFAAHFLYQLAFARQATYNATFLVIHSTTGFSSLFSLPSSYLETLAEAVGVQVHLRFGRLRRRRQHRRREGERRRPQGGTHNQVRREKTKTMA
jgi:hypothetical protein